ncbi:hypothetical protein P691DRAFT_797119 [Macrolepiota fuliginosa MF-IS2]|uniref:Uncharacterized protein n=1 Tax=Macrolepiota fuliginosa MF-IS2 TaxID=1400762 RepID=A0A9P5XIX8_9AGAR|nr:hypothetical protein P691DRAFT_797119 [Macrolepiota fuliginosa MF-IS2]
MEREELPRVSVGSVADWQRVQNNYSARALNAIHAAIDADDLAEDRDAILAHFTHFMDSTFSMAQGNLRVNGHHFETLDSVGQDMEAFDEALDRRIWSLADTRLQWHKRMGKTRREAPKEIQSRLSDLFNKGQVQDHEISEINNAMSDDDELANDSVPLSLEAIEEFQMTTAITEELDQNVPSQQGRVQRVEEATSQLKSLKY